jgi:hypothetical protein
MINLIELTKKFKDDYLIQRYNKQYLELNKYYLGGQIPLLPTDEITHEMVLHIKKIYSEIPHHDITNSWEISSFLRGQGDFEHFFDLFISFF